MRPVPHSEKLPVLKPLEILTCSDEKSDCHEDYIQQEEANVDCIPAFEESCSSPEPHLLIQGDLNDLVCDLNLSDKQHEFLLSILK